MFVCCHNNDLAWKIRHNLPLMLDGNGDLATFFSDQIQLSFRAREINYEWHLGNLHKITQQTTRERTSPNADHSPLAIWVCRILIAIPQYLFLTRASRPRSLLMLVVHRHQR